MNQPLAVGVAIVLPNVPKVKQEKTKQTEESDTLIYQEKSENNITWTFF